MKLTLAEARAKYGRLPIARGEDGEAMAVVRPKSAVVPLAIANLAVEKNDPDLLDRLIEESGEDYTFRGYLGLAGKTGYVVDEHGNIVDELLAGDSFVSRRGLRRRDDSTRPE